MRYIHSQKQPLLGGNPLGIGRCKAAWRTESDFKGKRLEDTEKLLQRKPTTSAFCGLFPADRIGRLVQNYCLYPFICEKGEKILKTEGKGYHEKTS